MHVSPAANVKAVSEPSTSSAWASQRTHATTSTPRPSREPGVAREHSQWHHLALAVVSAPASGLALAPLPGGGGQPPSLPGGGGGGGGGGGSGGSHLQAGLAGVQEICQLAAGRTIRLTLVSFAVTRKAYGKITKMFSRMYEEATGRVVRFQLSFGGSGTQARAVIDGLPADIAALALPLDVMKISEAGLLSPNWRTRFPNGSVVVESVVAIVVRKGNPKGIRGWDDLTRPDVDVIVANPKTAGVARWIFFALWGHRLARGEKAATEYVTRVFDRVEVQPRDAREASDVFYKQKRGDALLTYENEAVFTNLVVQPRERLPFIVPDNNVRIQCPIAMVDANLDTQPPEVRESARDFIQYLFQPPAQREFAKCGFRVASKEAMETSGVVLPPVKGLWTVEQRLGGWNEAQPKFFNDGGILSDIQLDVSLRRLQAHQAR